MNNSLFGNRGNEGKSMSLEDYKKLQTLVQQSATVSQDIPSEEIGEYEEVAVMESEKEMEITGPRLVKSLRPPRPNAFIDAIVLGFLVAVAGLTSVLYMLLNINSALY